MGTSCGGIAIKTDTTKIDLYKVVKTIFGNEFEKSESYCDSRTNNCVYIGKTKDFLVIINSYLIDTFLKKIKTKDIQAYLKLFFNSDFIFAFEIYDSGDTYSYTLLYNGTVKRQFKAVIYETITDIGEPDPIEQKWRNGTTIKEDLGGGESQLLYKHTVTGELCSESSLPRTILLELMQEKLGFTSENMDKVLVEKGYYKKNATTLTEQAPDNNFTAGPIKISWWKQG